jgi:AcrR family transcriptional regulator
VHHYFGGRKEVYIALVERLGAQREEDLRPPLGRSARARVADTVAHWLDWTDRNRTIYLATMGRGEDIADPEIRRVVGDLVSRVVAQLIAFHADIADDSPRLRHALECWTGLNCAATRRWLRGEATRDATDELLTLTLEHVLRTFGTRSSARPSRRRSDVPTRARHRGSSGARRDDP